MTEGLGRGRGAVAVADYTVCGVLVAEAYCAASNCPPSVSS